MQNLRIELIARASGSVQKRASNLKWRRLGRRVLVAETMFRGRAHQLVLRTLLTAQLGGWGADDFHPYTCRRERESQVQGSLTMSCRPDFNHDT